ncbi:MAG: hypothetical protein QW429_03085 [Thermoprotei archaeon]
MSQNSKTQIKDLVSLLKSSKIVVLRLNHRLRDLRVTTHVCLTARAFGANGVIIADTQAEEIIEKIQKLNTKWGDGFWVKDSLSAHDAINIWRSLGGTVINLSMYGEDLRNTLSELYFLHYLQLRPLLVLVGSSKVSAEMYTLADYNVSITDQPHSEVAALAVFLDKIHGGIWPQRCGKTRINPNLKAKGRISIMGDAIPDEKTY